MVESEPVVVVEEVTEEEVTECLPEQVEEDCDGTSLETDCKDHPVAVTLSVVVVFQLETDCKDHPVAVTLSVVVVFQLETDCKDHPVAVILSVVVVFELARVQEQAELELVMAFEPVQ